MADALNAQAQPSTLQQGLSSLSQLNKLLNVANSGSIFGPSMTAGLDRLGAASGLFGGYQAGNALSLANPLYGGVARLAPRAPVTVASPGALGSQTLSGMLSGAGIGSLVGMGANLIGYGRNAYGPQIGSALGGAVGSLIPGLGTIAGGLLGGALGSAVGGMFGGHKSVGPNSNTARQLNDGKWVNVGSGADNGANVKGINTYGDAIQQMLDQIRTETGVSYLPGSRFGTSFFKGGVKGNLWDPRTGKWVDGWRYNSDSGGAPIGTDPAAAAEKLIRGFATNFATGTPEQIAAMNTYLASDGFREAMGLVAPPAAGGAPAGGGAAAGATTVPLATMPQVSRVATAPAALPSPRRVYDPYAAARGLTALAQRQPRMGGLLG